MWPTFINGKRYRLAFEKPTRADTFRRRHHLRLWRTNLRVNKKAVWFGTLSYDRGVGVMKHSLYPTHHIGSVLNSEEEFLAKALGINNYLQISEPTKGMIGTGDNYVWDGKALVINLR